MFKKVVYEVTENWLEEVVISSAGVNREYLTKARVHDKVYEILMEHRYKVFNFEISLMNDRVKYTVRVTDGGVDIYHGKKLIYEESFVAPEGFEKTADWLAWKMVNDR